MQSGVGLWALLALSLSLTRGSPVGSWFFGADTPSGCFEPLGELVA